MSVSISRTEIKYIRNRSCSSGGMEACRADGSRVSLKACNYSPTPRNTELTNNANYCNYADASRAEAAFKTNSTANFHNNNSSLDYCLQQKMLHSSRCKNQLQRCNITLSLILDQSWLWNEVNMFTINETETRHVTSRRQIKSSHVVKSSHVTSRHVTSSNRQVTPRHKSSHVVKSRHVIKSSSHVTSRHVTSRQVNSRHFKSRQVKLRQGNSRHFKSIQVKSHQVKSSSHLHLYSAFNNKDCVKAALQ